MQILRRELFLSLHEIELMYAYYPPGHYYRKHVDRFQSDLTRLNSERVITIVLYLNTDYKPEDAGELTIYPGNGQPLKIQPKGGTLIIFDSVTLPHEVLPTNSPRYSATGWFVSHENPALTAGLNA